MTRWVLFPLALALAACATPEQRAAQWQAEVDEMVRVYGPACDKLGYKPDSDRWRDCVLRLSNRDRLRYYSYPRTTSCFGHRGFFTCSTF